MAEQSRIVEVMHEDGAVFTTSRGTIEIGGTLASFVCKWRRTEYGVECDYCKIWHPKQRRNHDDVDGLAMAEAGYSLAFKLANLRDK